MENKLNWIKCVFVLALLSTSVAVQAEGNPYDTAPVWSLDGQYIYFYTYRHGNAELYRMTPDGNNQSRITENDYSNWWSATLKDPNKLVVVSDRDSGGLFGGSNLFLLDMETGDFENMTNVSVGRWAAAPAVVKEKNIVLYVESEQFGRNMPAEIKILDLSDKEITSYPDNPRHNNIHPSVSADGSVVSYSSVRNGETAVYLNDLTGQNERLFMEVIGEPPLTTLSDDGKWIVFSVGVSLQMAKEAGERAQEREIFIARTDGSGLRRLTTSPGSDHGAVFSPDGKTITFASYRNGPSDIFAVDLDGSNERNLTRTSPVKPKH